LNKWEKYKTSNDSDRIKLWESTIEELGEIDLDTIRVFSKELQLLNRDEYCFGLDMEHDWLNNVSEQLEMDKFEVMVISATCHERIKNYLGNILNLSIIIS